MVPAPRGMHRVLTHRHFTLFNRNFVFPHKSSKQLSSLCAPHIMQPICFSHKSSNQPSSLCALSGTITHNSQVEKITRLTLFKVWCFED